MPATPLQTLYLPSDTGDVGRRVTLPGSARLFGRLSLATSRAFLTFAALDADVNSTVTAPPYATLLVRVSCSGTVYLGPGPFASAAPVYGAASNSGLMGGAYATVDAAHTAVYAGAWGSSASAAYAEPAARGCGAIFPIFTPSSFYLYQQELTAASNSARAWPVGVFPPPPSPPAPAYASTTSPTNGRAGYIASAANAGGMAGAFSAGTGFITLWWVEAGVAGVYRDTQTSASTWSVSNAAGSSAFIAWCTGSVTSDAGLVAVAYDTGSGLLFAAGAAQLHVSCAAPDTAGACAFALAATLEGALQFRGLASSPSACAGLRRRGLGGVVAGHKGAGAGGSNASLPLRA